MKYDLNENQEVVRVYENLDTDLDKFIEWFQTLKIPKRKPRAISKVEHERVLEFEKSLKEYLREKSDRFTQSTSFIESILKKRMSHFRLSKEAYENVYGDKGEDKIFKGKYATYIHDDVGSYSAFKKNVEKIDKFFSTLKGYHKKALKGLTVRFVSKADQKSAGKYISGKKILQINPMSKKVAKQDDAYASLLYIALHELGHKYLEENRQDWDINDRKLTTTRYSETDSWTGEERFAELFALSHWENKYPQYKEQIEIFKKNLK